MAPNDTYSLVFISLFLPLPHCVRIGLWSQQSMAEAKVCCFWDWVVKDCGLCIGSHSLGSLSLEESSCCDLRIHRQPKDRPKWQGTKPLANSQPTAANNHVNELRSRSSIPAQVLKWPQPQPMTECNLLRDLSEFPTLKNCEIRKIYGFQCYVLE